MGPRAIVAATVLGAGAVVAADLASKAWVRDHATAPTDLAEPRSLRPQWVHGEHEGARALGVAVAVVPTVAGAAIAAALTRFAAPSPLAIPAATLLATGAVLNGVELVARGTNTNPINVAGGELNVADLAVIAGAGLLGLSLLPAAVRLLAR